MGGPGESSGPELEARADVFLLLPCVHLTPSFLSGATSGSEQLKGSAKAVLGERVKYKTTKINKSYCLQLKFVAYSANVKQNLPYFGK